MQDGRKLQWNCFFCSFNYFPPILINLFLIPRGCSVAKVYSSSIAPVQHSTPVFRMTHTHLGVWICWQGRTCDGARSLWKGRDHWITCFPACIIHPTPAVIHYQIMQLISALCYWNGTTAHRYVPGKHATICSYYSSAVWWCLLSFRCQILFWIMEIKNWLDDEGHQ